MMRVLVTGGAGFVGSHLANRLYGDGHYVRVLDDLSSGDPTALEGGINFNRGDVRDIPKLWSLLQGVDVVYHLAARVSVPASILYPREYNDVNVGGTVALLEACRDIGTVARVVLASSATIYGNHSRQPVAESFDARPEVPYAVSKLAAEQYLFNIGPLSGFETVALRLFNAYGPGQPLPPGHPPVIPQFLRQTIGKGSLVIFGDGKQTRDFVFIEDVVDALCAAASAANIDGEVINIGSGVETSIRDLVAEVERATGQEPKPLYNQETSGGIRRLVADLTKSERLLNFRPRTQLPAGLRLFLEKDPKLRTAKRVRTLPNGATRGHADHFE